MKRDMSKQPDRMGVWGKKLGTFFFWGFFPIIWEKKKQTSPYHHSEDLLEMDICLLNRYGHPIHTQWPSYLKIILLSSRAKTMSCAGGQESCMSPINWVLQLWLRNCVYEKLSSTEKSGVQAVQMNIGLLYANTL